MKYGFDLDDTLSDTASIINKYAIKFDKEYLNGEGKMKKNITAKDYYYFADALEWNSKNIKYFFEVYYLDVIKNVRIKPLVSETIKRLKEESNEIYIITSRRKRENNIVESITKEWLNKNEIYYDDLFINIKEKSEIVNKLKINYFVDDSYSNCIEVKQKTKAEVYMIETYYNKQIIDKNIKKIENIARLIGGI